MSRGGRGGLNRGGVSRDGQKQIAGLQYDEELELLQDTKPSWSLENKFPVSLTRNSSACLAPRIDCTLLPHRQPRSNASATSEQSRCELLCACRTVKAHNTGRSSHERSIQRHH